MINPLKVFVANLYAANSAATGIPSIATGDILLLDRALTVLSPDTIAGDVNNDLIYVALGLSAGVAKTVAIPVKGIKKVTSSLYTPPVQHVVTIDSTAVPTTSAAGTSFSIKVFYHDTNRVMQDKQLSQFFTYKTLVANESATTIFNGLRTKINAVAAFSNQIVASGTTTLVLTGKAVTDNAFGLPQFRYFDVALRSGFDTTVAAPMSVTAGIPGKGTGVQVRQQELAGIYDFNRTQFPQTTDPRLASASGVYNTVTIQYETTNTSAFNRLASNLQTLVIAFAAAESGTPLVGYTTAAAPSTKQTNFVTQLNSLVESAGVAFVS